MERVMTQLAFYFAKHGSFEVTLIVMTKGEHFYELPSSLLVVEPDFIHSHYSRLRFSWKTLKFLRQTLRQLQPDAVLTFGGKYNSFVLLASLGLRLRIFISDRSRPGISYGKFLDLVNPLIYKYATGIIAQTQQAKDYFARSVKHANIVVIGNPIKCFESAHVQRENIILNVGRFIASKNQSILIEYFSKTNFKDWKLVFLGDGKYLKSGIQKAKDLGIENHVVFAGNQKEIDLYYLKSKIFAFTSVSEGFPNALGEAMAAGLACVSFDCIAGPGDIIDDDENGFLVPVGDDSTYINRLSRLMNNAELREKFGLKAQTKMERFEEAKIGKKFLDFMFDKEFRNQ
jgi:GalNAc-alpha-(1->4)-GalNAc-alpha-(1->3)-diNAcBac-PP-undecaprenol alpha-1,4-N-acetyl-D-galactosaminyltransferase